MQKIYHKDLTGDDLHWPKPHATTHMMHGSDRVPIVEAVDALPIPAEYGQILYLNTDKHPYIYVQ